MYHLLARQFSRNGFIKRENYFLTNPTVVFQWISTTKLVKLAEWCTIGWRCLLWWAESGWNMVNKESCKECMTESPQIYFWTFRTLKNQIITNSSISSGVWRLAKFPRNRCSNEGQKTIICHSTQADEVSRLGLVKIPKNPSILTWIVSQPQIWGDFLMPMKPPQFLNLAQHRIVSSPQRLWQLCRGVYFNFLPKGQSSKPRNFRDDEVADWTMEELLTDD